MKSNYNANPTIEEAVQQIEDVYKKVLNDEIVRAVALGGLAVWEILYNNYIFPIDNSKSEDERNTAIKELIDKIRREGERIKDRKAEAQKTIESSKEKDYAEN